jgi:hypothetical protein
MTRPTTLAIAAALAGCVALPARAQAPFVYPEKGQSAEQQSADEGACMGWAKQQTGFDPMRAPTPSYQAPQQDSMMGGAAKGALGGAAIGAIGGAIAGDAGKGAAIGAATGTLFGGARTHRENSNRQQQAQQQAQQQSASYDYARSEFYRAFGACMAGRGYTVR